MTNEQREAIEDVEEFNNKFDCGKYRKSIDTVLSLIKEQQEEIDELKRDNTDTWYLNSKMSRRHLEDICRMKKKDKQIDLMAGFIGQDMMCIRPEIECNKMTHDCKECIKQYFERKVEDVKD